MSGTSGEFGPLEQAARRGDRRAILAMHAFCYRIRKHLGGYISTMGGVDAIVFTGRIGAGNAWVRSLTCQGLAYMGIQVDEVLNTALSSLPGATADVSSTGSRAQILVIPPDEGRMIARESIRALGAYTIDQSTRRQARAIPLEVSAHHVHLAGEHVEALFGPGHALTVRSDLSQPGQYACQETVDLVGPSGRVERVRILGPERNRTQVEIAMTEQFKLGIRADPRLGRPGRQPGRRAGRPARDRRARAGGDLFRAPHPHSPRGRAGDGAQGSRRVHGARRGRAHVDLWRRAGARQP
jgi:acetate kinase